MLVTAAGCQLICWRVSGVPGSAVVDLAAGRLDLRSSIHSDAVFTRRQGSALMSL